MITASGLPNRWHEKVSINEHTGCHEWTGGRTTAGYGMFWLNGKLRYAHRVAFSVAKSPIPAGLHIDHLCRVRHCVNPEHMEAVTQAENNLRGVSPTAKNARKTHCANGHEYSPENTHITKTNGYRMCKECNRIRSRANYRARVEARNG